MKLTLKHGLQLLVLALGLMGGQHAAAQIAKDRGPVKLVVGFPAGGSADVAARMLADKLRLELGVPVIVDNRVGAGGGIAADYVRAQPGDGLTVLVANTHTMVTLPLTNKAIRFTALKDFKAVGRVAVFAETVTVATNMPVKTLTQWLDLARTDPARASFGVPAPGSMPHFMGYKLGQDAKAALLPVPYRGSAPMVTDLIGGQIPAGILPVADVVQLHQTGKVRVLAVNGSERAAMLPDVPTLKELGVPGFEALEWAGLFAPATTPRAIIDQLNAALLKALASGEVQQGFFKIGLETRSSTPDALEKDIADDVEKWAPIIKSSGFAAD